MLPDGSRWRRGAAIFLAAALWLLCGAPAQALPEDRDQPIFITADKAVRNEKRGVTLYSGKVHMRQGTLELDADNLVVFHEGSNTTKIVARGTPAAMRQQPEPDEGLVRAYGNIITYYHTRDQVNLRTNARIERDDGSLVTGDSIDYFILRELVTAESDEEGEGNKVFVVIPPSLHQQDQDEREDIRENMEAIEGVEDMEALEGIEGADEINGSDSGTADKPARAADSESATGAADSQPQGGQEPGVSGTTESE